MLISPSPLPDHPPPPPSSFFLRHPLHGPLPACLPACQSLPACLPACLPWLRLADVPCLTGKLNRYFTVSYPPSRLPPSSSVFLSPFPAFIASSRSCSRFCRALFVSGRRGWDEEGELREERHLPSLQSHFRESGTGQRRAALAVLSHTLLLSLSHSLSLDARVANIYLHIVLHVTIM